MLELMKDVRVYKVSASSCAVTLPKSWCERHGVGADTEVTLLGGEVLVVVPKGEMYEKLKEAAIRFLLELGKLEEGVCDR